MSRVFINLSNHPSDQWSQEQIIAARKFGDIVDMPFPVIPAEMCHEEVVALAKDYTERILKYDKPIVMVQGEFTFSYNMVSLLLSEDITVVAACSERVTFEKTNEDGTSTKRVVFRFAGFRTY